MPTSLFPHAKLDWTISRLEGDLEKRPEDTEKRLELARCVASRGLLHGGGEVACNEALALARKVLQEDPTSVEALVVAGLSLLGMERTDAAFKYLAQALTIEEDRADLRLALGILERQQSELGGSVRHLESACRLAPEAWETHLFLGRALMDLARSRDLAGRLVERAQYHLVRALQLEPSPDQHPPVLRDLGVCCMLTGRYRDAERFFIRLREHDEHAGTARYYLGQVAYSLGKYNNAIQHFRQYLRDDPDSTEVIARMAMCWFQLGDLNRARESCNQALLVDPEHLEARYALGCTLLEEGDPSEAVRVFRETLKDHPGHMGTYVELVRTRRVAQETPWLMGALESEVGNFDRLPPGGEVDTRGLTRMRIQAVIDELKEVGPSVIPAVLAAVDRTQDEALRFQLWEAACGLVMSAVADAAATRLREPGRHYGLGLGLEALSAASAIPEPVLTSGLGLEEEDLKRAAVDRHGPASDVGGHRKNLDQERKRARAYQALLLLAVGVRRSTSGRNLLNEWASNADTDLAVAAWAGLSMYGEPVATAKLAAQAANKGATGSVDKLLSFVVPPTVDIRPRRVTDDATTCCSTCGRSTGDVDHLMAGSRAVICDRCVIRVGQHRRSLEASDDAVCDLCTRTPFEVRGLYGYNGVHICSECLDLSLGLLEREEVDRFLAAW
jgi:tetratricopeptide (TPR) repeat protein